MVSKVTFVDIPVASVVYAHDTRLFPFSPRRAIDPNLVEPPSRRPRPLQQGMVLESGLVVAVLDEIRMIFPLPGGGL